MRSPLALLGFLAATAATAFFASRFEPGQWYETLTKPPWTPPDWLFAPVWALLYLGIAVAGWLVWREAPRTLSAPLALWVAQLVLNAAWSWLFFGLHRPGAALVDIVLLLAAILAFIVAARPVSRAAAWLFVPYALWVGYATTLNLYIWRAG